MRPREGEDVKDVRGRGCTKDIQTSLTPLSFVQFYMERVPKAGEGIIDMYIFVGLKAQPTFSIGEGITTTC